MKATHIVTGLAFAAVLSYAALATAHPGGPGYGQGGNCGGGPGFAGGNPVAASEGRLAWLKAELKITASQEAAWNAFVATSRERAAEMQAHREAMFSTGAAPERFAQRARFMQERVAGMEASAAALKDLYAALTPEQKATADALLAHGPGGGPGRGRGWGAF